MRDVFEMLAEMGAKIDHDVGRFEAPFPGGEHMGLYLSAADGWPTFRSLSTVIEWAKDLVPGEWCLVVNRAEARRLWDALAPHDQLMIRLFRPKDTPTGWMMSFDGVDIVEDRTTKSAA